MKKKYIVILLIIMFGLGIGVDKLLLTNNDIDDGFSNLSQVEHKNMLSMMLEQTAGAGDYSLKTRSSWPTKEDGYVFNSTLSKCENGSRLSWDDESSTVKFKGSVSDKCYVYFDKYSPTLAEYVIAQYTGTQGENNLYYHNGTILGDDGTVLDAGDNSYRYAGSSDTTNNFVCFGSDATPCPNDNLYRIIGVFGDQVKLIKWDYATTELLGTDGDYSISCSLAPYCGGETYGTSKGTNTEVQIGAYYWNYANYSTTYNATNYYNVWSYSKLNTVNLNTNYIKNIGNTWANKIADTTWKVGGNIDANIANVIPSNAYTNEYTNPNTTIEDSYSAKVGLMYTSDYGFASSPSSWTTALYKYDSSSIVSVNWMYMGLSEWTVVRRHPEIAGFNIDTYSFFVRYTGVVVDEDVSSGGFAIRPVFYLNSDVIYVSGSGTKEDSIRIN